MRNLLAYLIALIAFAASVALVNSQGAAADASFSLDIREAVERLAVTLAYGIDSLLAESGLTLPYAGAMAVGAFGLAIPSLFVFALLGRTGRS